MDAFRLVPSPQATTWPALLAASEHTPEFPVAMTTLVDDRRKEEWTTNPERFLKTSYDQFCNVIMMVTFTGGIQIAALSFMNDITTSQASTPIEPMLKQTGINAWYYQYTVQSFGFMLGFNAVFLCGVCGAVAAVNAALISYYFVHPPQQRPALEGHLLFCMLLLFGTFVLSGVSLTLLSTKFDYPFMLSIVFLLLFGLVVAGYQIGRQAEILRRLTEAALRKPVHALSAIFLPLPFVLSLLNPMASSWFAVALSLLTCAHYIAECVFDKGDDTAAFYLPRGNQALFATALSLSWGGCAFIYVKWMVLSPSVAGLGSYGLALSASLEAILMVIIAGIDWHGTWQHWGSKKKHGVPA